MKKDLLLAFSILILLKTLAPSIVSGQTRITFRIDMRPQMKDSTFISTDHTVTLTGNQLPFSKTRTIELKDKPPVDSIYVTTINFPSLVNGKILKYSFLIKKNNENISERRSRLLPLRRQKQTLPIVLFNSFSQ